MGWNWQYVEPSQGGEGKQKFTQGCSPGDAELVWGGKSRAEPANARLCQQTGALHPCGSLLEMPALWLTRLSLSCCWSRLMIETLSTEPKFAKGVSFLPPRCTLGDVFGQRDPVHAFGNTRKCMKCMTLSTVFPHIDLGHLLLPPATHPRSTHQ